LNFINKKRDVFLFINNYFPVVKRDSTNEVKLINTNMSEVVSISRVMAP